ncbi:uncharacterized protein LOC113677810, partial [Pocillopora damicornis]|uniref:uncharacterized protein LOC113677810 n=1 Tax=Pocillopora damicornis TaxID=46731 RepID=UPI000F5560ED
IKSSLDMPELKGETFTMQGKLEFIGKQSRTLEEVYTKVTRMTGQACACDKFVRRQFYDFTFCNLKAVHDDLNARVADLKSADTKLTKEENEKLQILLADQRGREKQVEQLEATRVQLFFCAEEEQRISQYSTPERRKSAPSIPVQEIKDYMNTTDQFAGNTPKQTEQVVVEDLTCTVNQISESIEKLQKTLADIKSSLEVPELKGETFTMQRKSEFIGRHSRTLEGVYTKVTRMTDQACAFKEFVRRQFYDFTFYNLKAAHSDLNVRVADLKSVDTNFTKEENERLQILLADQRGGEKQVEQLETTRTQLFSTAEEEQRISQYSTSERRKSAPSIPVQLPSANTDGVSPKKSTKIKRNKTWSLFRSWRKSSEIPAVKGSENMCNLVSYSQKAPEDS